MRKGNVVRTTCFVNNGVTPEAIKNGLVAGSVVEGLRNLGAPIPQRPGTVPASQWGDLLASSPVGEQLLYGKHPPVNYRVKYTCSGTGGGGDPLPPVGVPGEVGGPIREDDEEVVPETEVPVVGGQQVLPETDMNRPFYSSTGILGAQPCLPNPAVDGDGDYVDGPYRNSTECPKDAEGQPGWCNPGTITFACIGEEEMCIGVSLFYALPRIGGEDHDEAMANLEEGNVNEVGTPGSAPRPPTDNGICHDCKAGL
jgi:hypothetical protein